ncbi:MAG: Fe-S cluster assembly protein SufD [Flavobacteriales bacterium]|nr:Fe-S cluster assembly protein SufD [Flavobacteriales bacterium]MCB9193479.1 Fe-S cluster assembly protein SufD [Flavobacteriales bacterium]
MSTETITDLKGSVLPLLEGSTWPGASEALQQVRSLPVPTTRTEAWKYTRVSKLFNGTYAAPEGDAAFALPDRLPFDATRIVFVNGHFREDLSDDLRTEKHVVIDSLQQHLSHGPVRNHYGHITPLSERLFSAMNAAAPTDGLLLLVFRNTTVRKPIHVLRITTEGGQLVQPRDLFLIQEGANAEVIEEHVSTALDVTTSLVNSLRECYVAEGAELLVHKLQRDGAAHISQENVQVDAKGRFSISTTTLEGSLVRNDLNVSLAGPGAHAELNGIYLLNGTTHCDNHTYIGHHVPDCTSDELYKGIVSDRATGVFNGKVYVKQDAQRTRAYQSNANILQGDHAKVYSKPELEIYADDVKCSHGCTIGRLDEKALFYLRSRGVSEVEARQLLAHAFTTDVLERIKNTDWEEYLTGLIDQKLDTL